MTLPEGKGGGAVIKKHPHDVRRVSIASPFELADADTPETLALLQQLSK
jgi:molybdenum cofactor cytidylyltransferase